MLSKIHQERKGKRRRASSYDRTGGNFDFFVFQPGENKLIMADEAAGMITHIWVTMGTFPQRPGAMLERKVVIKMYWDGEENPSVLAPIGDFFGMGHGLSKNFVSAPLTMCPQDGRGYNCYFPMPYARGARVEIENQADEMIMFYFYVDYESYAEAPSSSLRFHAQWRRELTRGIDDSAMSGEEFNFGGFNTSVANNYTILQARGRGHYVGCNLNIHNLRQTDKFNWPGEGDDMIVIDDEPWPPRLHGTGCEDYFGTAFCPEIEYHGLYNGVILPGGPNWSGRITYYRYHIADPVMFDQSIHVSIEHGHNNHRSDDYSSTAYWYQTEPHLHLPLPAVQERLPLPDLVRDITVLPKLKDIRDKKAREMGVE